MEPADFVYRKAQVVRIGSLTGLGASACVDTGFVFPHCDLMIADLEGTVQCDAVDGAFVCFGIRIGLTVRPHHEPSPSNQDHALRVGRADDNVSQGLKRCFEGTLEEISAEVCDPGADLDAVFPKMIQGC